MTDLKTVPFPYICDGCTEDFSRQILNDGTSATKGHYCPHSESMVIASMEEIDGELAITNWMLQGPLTVEQAAEIARKLGELEGTETQFYPSVRLQ